MRPLPFLEPRPTAPAARVTTKGHHSLDLAALQAGSSAGGGPLAITSSRMSHVWGALGHAYEVLRFVASHPGGIGYVSGSADEIEGVKVLKILD